MKVLHIISGDLSGGAAKGAYLLHRSLRQTGVDSRVLTNAARHPDDDSVISIGNNKWQRFRNGVIHRIDRAPLTLYPSREQDMFSNGLTGISFTSHSAYRWADLIHLHWINGGMTNVRRLSKIDKPAVWTLRDMWPMTGGCHYSLGCAKYKTACGQCVHLHSASYNDLSRVNFNRKRKYYPPGLVYVAISPWLAEKARNSGLLKSNDIRMIFNNIDCSGFFPVDKKEARKALKINSSKKIILVGAQKITDAYKGFGKFADALSLLDSSEYLILTFGRFHGSEAACRDFEHKNFGFVHDQHMLRLLYSAADVFVAPSLMDAFCKTLAESMACGTPPVCFDASGPKYVVDHMQNGYKAVPYDPCDLSRGIEWVTHANGMYDKLALSAREKAVSAFDNIAIAKQYNELYYELLEKTSKK